MTEGQQGAFDRNPFSDQDSDRHEIWNILVRGDFEAFLAADWSLMEPDFAADDFCGIDAHFDPNPDRWTITFPDVNSYRDHWLRQAAAFREVQLVGIGTREFLYRSVQLAEIQVTGNRALAHKKFDGSASCADGEELTFRFQSLFQMVRRRANWKISGFVGYLPP